MQSSELSASQNNNRQDKETPRLKTSLQCVGIWIIRVILGLVFAFSGFSKAVDPWGGMYKMSEYFTKWGVTVNRESVLILAGVLSGFEFVLGFLLLFGAYKKSVRWLALVFMSFMTILTLYIWIFNPVTDCGCFGEAFIISNSLTFWKNIILLVLTVLLFMYNTRVEGLLLPKLQWTLIVVASFYIIAIQIYGYHVQPMIDFRPFPVGTNMTELTQNEEENVIFVYEKDGFKEEFSADNLPDETWHFVERKTASPQKNILSVFEDEEEVSEEIFADEGIQYVLIVSDPIHYGLARSNMANSLYDYAKETGADMFAIVAIASDKTKDWIEATGAKYPVYTAEDTDLKMLARGDAAVMMVENGIIKWKSNVFALSPEFPYTDNGKVSFKTFNSPLKSMTIVFLTILLSIFILSRLIVKYSLIKFHKKQTK